MIQVPPFFNFIIIIIIFGIFSFFKFFCIIFLNQRKNFYLKNFLDVSKRKERQQPFWLINFANI